MIYCKYITWIIIFSFSSNLVISQELANLNTDPNIKISIFASNIDSPRQLAEGEDGRIYVGSRNAGEIYAIRDTDKNGVVDEKILVAKNLTYATGISIFAGDLYLSEINKIWKIENISQVLSQDPLKLPEKSLVTDNLPSDKWHGWKWIKHDEEGRIYTNVGAPCNACISEDQRYASILRLNEGSWEFIARGVRNSVGFDFHPTSKKLYFTDNGRDWLGDDSPSCELNRVDAEGAFYGFPYKHANSILDPDFGELNPGYNFINPIEELGAHVAPTGIAFYKGEMFPQFNNNLFITLHGSWNRSSKVGYKVIRVILDNNGEVLEKKDFITGWLKDGEVSGRPSSVFVMRDGSLLISDDKANVIYQVTQS